ncbi:MAG TPA: hypothetical protein VL442_19900 [Mucilaginibacter sp.]|jgi:hypothetical protein|nr:hypothetical protein [Mucilaginibacter sp.]
MTDVTINNAEDLKAEILRLKHLKEEQGEALKARFSSPGAAISSIMTIFPKESRAKFDIFHQDFFGLISRILLPLTLNKTLFRNSNFVIKGLVGFLSQKASHFISEDSVTGIWDKVKSLFEKKKHKEEDFGIPPESEAS